MKKINLRTRDNMTFLAKAYLERLFPRAIKGEIFFEKDLETESGYVYFESNYYDNTLFAELNNSQTLSKIKNSNASQQWIELISVLKDFEEVDDINVGSLDSYSLVDENFSIIKYSEERLNSILDKSQTKALYLSIQEDLKNIYPSLGFDVFRQDGVLRATLRVPIKAELEQRFDFLPIVKILEKHNQSIKNIKLFKGKDENSIYFSVFFDGSNP